MRQQAISQYKAKNYTVAAQLLQQQIKTDPSDASNYDILGNVDRDNGHTSLAISDYKQAIATSKTLLPAYLNLANVYLNEGDKTDASTLVTQALVVFPKNTQLLALQTQSSTN